MKAREFQAFEPRFSVDSPYVADYFGLWMIHDETFAGMVNQVNGKNLSLHFAAAETLNRIESGSSRLYEVSSEGIATFYASGPMMKSVPSLADGTSYLMLRRQLASARRDPEVRGAMLMMDTPGGTARGNEDTAKEIAKFAAEKPIYAFTEDMTCSAGVSLSSQCTKRYANNATAMYGAMGTYAVIQDMSGMAEKMGVKVHVIRAGEFKGAGTAGTEVTEEQLQEMQRITNTLNDNYLGLIAGGLNRSVDSIRELADGRVILAADAVAAKLIDGVQSIEETMQQLRDTVSQKLMTPVSNHRSEQEMDDKTPATLQELKQTFPNSNAEWREGQLEAGNDISQAAVAYASHVEAQAAAAAEQHAKEMEEAKKVTAKSAASSAIGHQPMNESGEGDSLENFSGDPVADFHSAVNERLPKGRSASYAERQSAIAYVARTRPTLHQAFVAAHNTSKTQKRLLDEKYETAS